ncbi:internalin-like protein [Bifidobacterium thermophilum]|uniref:Internalin-like protein n=1 Tax=Bifidobacterium thermophilum TaxID=33905 RepID=A0A2N3QN93_9BIFI|nr:InlB B-repeat-containing protein [Bifidobacterium thermophilum]PKU93104.1 internalin-like protein [Bifidobacterium thermophilum]
MDNSHRPWIAGVAVLAMIGSLACVPPANAAETQPAQDASSQQTAQQQAGDSASGQNGEDTENSGNTGNGDSADASKPDTSDDSAQEPAAPSDTDAGMSLSGSTRTLTAGGMYYTAVSTKSPAGIQPGTYRVSGGKFTWTHIEVCDYDIAKDSASPCDRYDVGGSYGSKTIEVYPNQVVQNGYDGSYPDTTWQLVKSRNNSAVMSPQGSAKWMAKKGTRYSSLASSSPASIAPGIYLVDATAEGGSSIKVDNYLISEGRAEGFSTARYYSPAYHQHYEIIQVNAGQIVQLDGDINTRWQLLKSLPKGEVLTPQSKVYTKARGAQFFSNIDAATSPQASIPAGVYLVSTAEAARDQSLYITVSDFDATQKQETGTDRDYSIWPTGSSDYAVIQVNAQQKITCSAWDGFSTKWQLLKTLPNSGVRVPGKKITKTQGTYRVPNDLSAGMYLVSLANEYDKIEICDTDPYTGETQDCDGGAHKLDSYQGPQTYFEIVLKSGQVVKIDNGIGESTVTSYWQPLPAPLPTYSVAFDSRGGSKVDSQSVRKGSKVARPKNPTRTGYSFRTWTVDAAGKKPYNFNAAVTKNLRLYAQWTARKYTVYFNANGGTVKTRSKTVTYGGKYGDLPSGSRKGYRLSGWWTAKSGGSQVTANTVYRHASNQTLYARWTDGMAMYRLYNKYTGEHFYTSSAKERTNLVKAGWNAEGTGWVAPFSGTPVYRLYNPYVAGGDHHYTTNTTERAALIKAGWRAEGIGWYSGGKTRILRQYNPYAKTGTHNYTSSSKEQAALVKAGWRAEGTGWYALR